ncbi:unnamed protein product [Oncorhynchus mykiss]|uniref:Mitochondrial import inner membrane translocase subunit Tim21 n=1 Tax=Oncorhynchus mykiss TaxID=8022 RepID=A0A060YHH4_ONCMY|nr:unnamed protein product [Oncorhynchus mykiss]
MQKQCAPSGTDYSAIQIYFLQDRRSLSYFLALSTVKEAGKNLTYLIVVLIGLGVTGGLLYVVFQELFSSSSPNKVYSKAFNEARLHPEVIGVFGEPIKCFGETSRRGRRQRVSHVDSTLKEKNPQGTVHTESKEVKIYYSCKFRYILVEVDTYPRRTIVIVDNR